MLFIVSAAGCKQLVKIGHKVAFICLNTRLIKRVNARNNSGNRTGKFKKADKAAEAFGRNIGYGELNYRNAAGHMRLFDAARRSL